MEMLKNNWKTVVIAILAILAVVFGILFIDGNAAKNELEDRKAELTTAQKNLADLKTETSKQVADLEAAAAQAATDAEATLNEAKEAGEKAVARVTSTLDATQRREKANRAELKNANQQISELTEKVTAQEQLLEDAKPYLEGEIQAQAEAALVAAVDAAKAEAAEAAEKAKTEAENALTEAVNAAKAEAAEAAEKAKAEAESALTEAVNAAKTEAEAAAATAKEAADTAQAAAVEAAKAEAQATIDELNAKVTSLEATLQEAQSALEGENAEKAAAIEAAKAEAEAAAAKAKEAADAAQTAAVEAAKAEAAKAQEEAVAAVKAEAAKAQEETVAAVKAKEEAEAALKTAEEKVAALEAEITTLKESAEKAAPEAESLKVMTHDEFAAADLDSEVLVETFVQATQSWYEDKIKVYAQSPDGAYFIYDMACSETDAAKLFPGTPIRVKGFKSEWNGEVEITDATFEIIDGETFIAEPEDVTAKLGTDELIKCQNKFVGFKGMTVEAYDETGAAFAYKNAENKTDDLYFKVSKDGQTYEFCVEFYLCGQDTEVYKAVEALQVGDVIDMEGFLYWYNGANPHITKVTKAQ